MRVVHDLRAALGAGRQRPLDAARKTTDPLSVVKLFTPDGGATWLLTELDPEDTDIAYGLCDLGMGNLELGSVRLSEVATVRGKFGLPVERGLWFAASKPLSAYAIEAVHAGRIVA